VVNQTSSNYSVFVIAVVNGAFRGVGWIVESAKLFLAWQVQMEDRYLSLLNVLSSVRCVPRITFPRYEIKFDRKSATVRSV